MNWVHYSPITDPRHTDPLLDLSSSMTADPGSVMAPQESRALQDGYYKTSGGYTPDQAEESLSSGSQKTHL